MKKLLVLIIFLLLLIVGLYFYEREINKEVILITDRNNIENNNSLKKGNNIELETIQESNIELETKEFLEKINLDLNDSLNKLSRYSIDRLIGLNCKSMYNSDSNIFGKKSRILVNAAYNKCLKLKEDATNKYNKIIQNREKAIKSFSINDCKKIAENKIKLQKVVDGVKLNTLEQEIEYCEVGYAWKKGCEVLIDINKRKKCIELKSFEKKQLDIEKYNNFDLSVYLDK